MLPSFGSSPLLATIIGAQPGQMLMGNWTMSLPSFIGLSKSLTPLTGGIAEPSTSETAFSPASSLLATSAAAFSGEGLGASRLFFNSWGLIDTCCDLPAGAILSHQR